MKNLKIKPEFITDDEGRKKAVVLSLKDYKKLVDEIEDYQDAIELEYRAKTAKGFTPYEKIRKRLKNEGKL